MEHPDHPRYDYHTIYQNVKHGDIVFTTGYEFQGTFDKFLVLANKGIVHGGIIVEENGVKYLIHGFPGEWGRPHLDEKPFMKGTSIRFRLYKEPFINPMLRDKNTLFYQVFRHPHFTLNMKEKPKLTDDRWFYFCTAAIAKPLVDNGVIREEHEKIISYQPDSMIHQLHDHGYESFYMIHDRSLDLPSTS